MNRNHLFTSLVFLSILGFDDDDNNDPLLIEEGEDRGLFLDLQTETAENDIISINTPI